MTTTNQTKFNYTKRRIEELEYNIQLLTLMIDEDREAEKALVNKIISTMEAEIAELILLGDEDGEPQSE